MQGGITSAILNAANEMAVGAFLKGRVGFTDIGTTVAATLQAVAAGPADDLETILAIDAEARAVAEQTIRELVNY